MEQPISLPGRDRCGIMVTAPESFLKDSDEPIVPRVAFAHN